MDYSAAFQISAGGMAVEKLRLDIAAVNIANMHHAGASASQVFRPLKVMVQESALTFAEQFGQIHGISGGGVQAVSVEPQQVEPRMVYEPGHPYADGKGFVAYPGINHSAEMVSLNTALRAYEANIVAMNAARTMASRTLDIGGQ